MLAAIAPSLAALALVALAGLGLQALLPRPLERSRIARLGLAYLLGAAWVALGGWAAGFCGATLGRALWLALALSPVVAGGVASALRRDGGGLGRVAPFSGQRRWPAVAVVVVVAAECVALLAHTTVEPVADFDGRMTWGTQARYLAASGSVTPDALRDPRAYVIHPRYPLVMPLLQVASVELADLSLDSFGVRPLYVLFLPAFAAALWPALRRAGGDLGAALAAILLFGAPLVLGDRDAGPLGTYSDFPLASFLGAGLALLLHPRARREPWRGWCAGLLLGAAAGAKNEGMLLAPAALALAAWYGGRLRRDRRALSMRAGVVLALVLAMIVAWRVEIPNRNDESYFEAFSPAKLATHLPARIALVAPAVARLSLDRERWGFLFWLAPGLLILGGRGLRRRDCRVAAALLVAQLAMVVAAYSVVGKPDIVEVTWNRFLLQSLGPLALVLAAAGGTLIGLARRRA